MAFPHCLKVVLSLLVVPVALLAQSPNGNGARPDGVKLAHASRAPEAPRVDGVLDDAVWQRATVHADFVQYEPDEGAPVTEPTEFRVLYTDRGMFVAIRAHDSQASAISGLLTRRDESSPSDDVTVLIDSYRDRRTAFGFAVNAAGVKRDFYVYADTQEDDRWDAVWDVATTLDDEGWSAEFFIPFSQLRFAATDRQTFGFNITRRIVRLNERQHWRLIPKQSAGMVSEFGDLEGLNGLTPPRRLEVQPYTLVRGVMDTEVTGDPFRTGRDASATAGADIKYGLSSSLTLTATINPDFGQIEADPAVVNLSAFETFYPERRPFFTEGLDIFRFRIADGDGDGSEEELFYTRRIGRAPQGSADDRGGFVEPVDRTTILAAAKLSGKTAAGWTVGVVGALTDREAADVVTASGDGFRDVIEPRSGYLVGRLAREVRDGRTTIGLFGTTVQRSLPDRLAFLHSAAYSGGLDWTHRFANDAYQFSGRIVGSAVLGSPEAITRTQESSARYYQRPDQDYLDLDSSRTELLGSQIAMNLGRFAGAWRWSVGFDTRSPGYEVNDIGFQREADFLSQFVWINRRWLEPGKVFRRFNLNFNQWSSWTRGWERRNVGGNVNFNFTFSNYWYGWGGVSRSQGGISVAALRGGPSLRRPGSLNGWWGAGTDGRKSVQGELNGWWRVEDQTPGNGGGLGTYLSIRPASNVTVSLGPNWSWNHTPFQYLDTQLAGGETSYLFGDLRQTTVSMSGRANVTFTPSLSLQMFGEPFVSSGRYDGYAQVADPTASRVAGQFESFGPERSRIDETTVSLDVNGDGASDVDLDRPDFTVLSFRSNVVLRWEYSLGSTIFLVWQHGRAGDSGDGRFTLGGHLDDLWHAQASNVLMAKVNYWLGR
jgi:hypothetical protein